MPTWFIILWVITGGALIVLTIQHYVEWTKTYIKETRIQRIIRKQKEQS